MPIYQAGSINTTALIVPNLYVQIVPPQNLLVNGVPSNMIGVVGSAAWGPKNVATIIGNMQQYAATFGSIQARKYDMGTQVATAVQQGANNFRCVRVTDGTDVAATSAGVAGAITFAALYTGSLGNSLVAALSAGTRANTWRFTIGLPGLLPEIYDNISGTGNAFWVNLAAAINAGNGVARGPSALIAATAAAGTTAPSAQSFAFTAGTDGATGVSATTLLGADGLARTGQYALRNQGCALGVLADCDTSTAWTTADGFGLSEGIYFIHTAPAGSVIANGSTGTVDLRNAAGLDSYASKLMHGDWCWWNDPANQILRLVSPQGFAAGRLANLSPEQSSLNKPIYGIAGTQRTGLPGTTQQQAYSQADLAALIGAGIDVIQNPSPGGNYYSTASGHNTSSNASVNGDNYTRLTDYIAATLSAGMGKYVGQVVNASLFQRIRSTQMSFLSTLLQQGILGSTDGSIPYSVVCDTSNNPPARTGLGYVQSDAQIRYQAINERFIVNVEGGQPVNVLRQQLQPLAA